MLTIFSFVCFPVAKWIVVINLFLCLIFTQRDIYIDSNLDPLTNFNNSSRITMKFVPISKRIVKSYAMKRDIPSEVWRKIKRNWDYNMIRISQRESHCRTNTSIRRTKSIQKSRTLRTTARDPRRKVKYLSKVIWDG